MQPPTVGSVQTGTEQLKNHDACLFGTLYKTIAQDWTKTVLSLIADTTFSKQGFWTEDKQLNAFRNCTLKMILETRCLLKTTFNWVEI